MIASDRALHDLSSHSRSLTKCSRDLVVVCLFLIASPLGAQAPFEQMKRDAAEADLHAYHALLEMYGQGDDTSVQLLLEWTPERITRAMQLANRPSDPVRPWEDRRFRLAAMLHTDAALRLFSDENVDRMFWHLETSSRILSLGTLEAPRAIGIFARQWYFTMGRYFRSVVEPYVAEKILKLGRERLPNDPGILEESGTLAELLATDYALSGLHVSPSHPHRIPIELILNRRSGNLSDATRWLRQATVLDPSNDAVQLHLGRVLALRQEDDEALRILGGVLARAKDSAVGYLAALFVGGVRERQGRLTDAAGAYRVAIGRFSQGQAAYIGLSEVLQQAGKGDEAREILEVLLHAPGNRREPLWWYQFDPDGAADERLVLLRKQARQ